MGFLSNCKHFLNEKAYSNKNWSLINIHIKYDIAKVLRLVLGDEGYAKWFYKQYMGKPLNLDNPTTVGDKLWWLKLNNRDSLMTICSDKVAARRYVSEHGFEDILIPQYDVLSSVEELNLCRYQDEVIVKCSHNSGWHLFYNPNNPPEEKEIVFAKKRFKYLLKQDASNLSLEWNYKNIPPKLIVEKVIRDEYGEIPFDYKFWCMDGEPKMMHHIGERYNEDHTYNSHHKVTAYDMDFNVIQMSEVGFPYSYEKEYKPEHWEKMKEIAKELSKPFPFCRVDLYYINKHIYFGELTFYDAGGCIAFEPKEWDEKVANWINLNSKNIVFK